MPLKETFKTPVMMTLILALGLGIGALCYPRWHQNRLNLALQDAVTAANTAQVEQLLTSGAETDTLVAQGMTPLSRAAMHGDEDIARVLIQHGADVRFRGVVGTTALYLAAEYGYPNIVQMLLAKGADPNVKNDRGHTSLDVAESIRRVRSRSSFPLRPPTVATIDVEIRLLKQAGAKPGDPPRRRK